MREVYVHLYKMSRTEAAGDLSICRTEAYNILTKVFQSLALLNGTYFTKGWGKNKDQIMQLTLKPAELEERLHKIMISRVTNEIRELCEKLTQDTLDIVLEMKEAYAEASYPDRMHGFYEEIKGILDKVRTACETENYDLAFFGALAAQDEIARALFYAEKGFSVNLGLEGQALYDRLGFLDLIPLLDPLDFTSLLEAVERLDTLLQNHLKERGVLIHRFEGITSLAQFLETR
ncbi:hypothetical protein [Paenibacillus sp. LHD-38]|uniref:hypothetical protein n=1 Tax=Paenibacillus sp. LHD-38 TaxID=3072143 RepID=UPI00280E4940|nr:hypothetical protein [Paenibacillus sp. LHD-38]MDQ8736061.1 hypothetical protein [Paenibacillus sp. LHD-38]